MPDLSASRKGSNGRKLQRLRPSDLTAPQKAALVIAALGPEAAGPIIERVEDKHLRAFARAYSHLQSVPQAALKVVVEEFVGRLSTTSEGDDIKGGVEETREFLGKFIGSDDVFRVMDGINLPDAGSVWEKLDRASDEGLAKYLENQNPQVSAVVLSKINTEKASRILDVLDEEAAQKIITRLARAMHIKPDVLQVLSNTIERDFLTVQTDEPESRNPGEMIGGMMNNIMSSKRDNLMSFIAESVPDILSDVRKAMLTFQDIPERVPAKAVPMAVKEIDHNLFLQAAKYGRQNAPSSVDFIFENISQRMRKQYEEEMEKLKHIPVNEAEAAQATFMTIVRKLAASGEIELNDIEIEEDEEADGEGGDS